MLIDIIFIILLVTAIFKGYTKGIIIAVFSILALVIGLAAAMKLSVVVASRLKDGVHITARWLPVLAFAVVFIIIVLLVRLGARALEKMIGLALLGWANKLAGVIVYIILYTVILSVVLFYAEKVDLVAPDTIAASRTYAFIKPWGAKAIDAMGTLLPFFKNMFYQLEDFFAGLSDKMQHR